MPATNQYELTFILGEKASQDTASAKTEELKKHIASLGGTIEKEEAWGRRELAYVIKRNRSGYYVTLWFDLPADQVKPLERHLRFDEDVIRSLVTKAYKNATPGSLYPVKEDEEEKQDEEKQDTATAEEAIRRSTAPSKKTKEVEADTTEEMPEEERLKKLEETLDEMLKDEE